MDDGFSNSGGGSDDGSGSEQEDDKEIDLENQFYSATDELEEKKFKTALASFRKCVKMEADFIKSKDVKVAKWTFKALQEIVALCLKLNQADDALVAYKQMLRYKLPVFFFFFFFFFFF
jgi:hypothetical protein